MRGLSDLRFGQPIPSTVSDPAMLHGWNKRPDQWELEASVQHQLVPRVGVEVGYFRRWYGNFTVTDNADWCRPTTRSSASPRRSMLDCPTAAGTWWAASTTSTRTKWVRSTISSPWPAITGIQRRRWNGVDVNLNLRLGKGAILQGGTSTGRTSLDVCDLRTQLPELTVTAPYVSWPDVSRLQYRGSSQTQVKFLGTYAVPKVDVQIAATFRSLPGVNIVSNYVATNAEVHARLLVVRSRAAPPT